MQLRVLGGFFGTIVGSARFVTILAAAAIGASANAQSNVIWPNDECAFATPIAGDGAYGFDTGSPFVSTSLPPLPSSCPGCTCSTTFAGIASDVWYLWTATCTGQVQMRTEIPGDTYQPPPPAPPVPVCLLDTVLAVYNTPCPAATATPVTPIVCCDDSCGLGHTCGLASYVQFDVVCGEKYLVRVGKKPGTVGGFGTLKIRCLGTECQPPPAQSCPDCCGAKPHFDDPLYTNNYTGQVAVMTGNDDTESGMLSDYPVVTIFNLRCSAPQPVPGAQWNPVAGPPSTAFRYSGTTDPITGDVQWTKDKLGSVFGVTLDGEGNIYVAHSSIYGIQDGGGYCTLSSTAIGSAAGINTSTSIYKIAVGTGVPMVFVNLPGGTSGTPGSTSGTNDPGLGNITFDCDHQEFFVSHFGDGRIYRISPSGTILGWFDHATNTIGLGFADDPAGPYTDFVPLGERVWAVQAHDGRLYYSVWGQNQNLFMATAAVGTTPNRIWSIGLLGNGNFVAASRRPEIQPPTNPGNDFLPAALNVSSPVSDISFSPSCRMLLAERSMGIVNCTLAHTARALEYEFPSSTISWVPTTNYRGGLGYEIGELDIVVPTPPPLPTKGTNSAGGCDYDFAAPDSCGAAGRLWVTGDALIYDFFSTPPTFVYGLVGLDPVTAPLGTTLGTSLFIDYNSDNSVGTDNDKTKQGDVEIPCKPPCLNVSNEKVICKLSDTDPPLLTGCYNYTFDITNKTGVSVQYITLPTAAISPPGVTISPNVIDLLGQTPPTPLLDDGETTTITITICGGDPDDMVYFHLSLQTTTFDVCCFQVICVELPDCDCGQLSDQEFSEVICNPDGTVDFTFNFVLENLSEFIVTDVFLIPLIGESCDFDEDYFDMTILVPLAGLLPGGSVPMRVQIVGANPGGTCCFNVVLKHFGKGGDDCCCPIEKCITVPECPDGALGACCCPFVAPPGTVVCCHLTLFNCVMTTQRDCQPGYWQGPGTTCPFDCIFPVTLGCCTLPDGTCTTTTEAPCMRSGGTWDYTAFCDQNICTPFQSGQGDLNGDCVINSLDLGILLSNWSIPSASSGCGGALPCPADLNHDGFVNSLDLGILLASWSL